jgi:hypothetical protein
MSTYAQPDTRRPIAVFAAVALCGLLATALAAGTVVMAWWAWSAGSDVSPYERENAYVAVALAVGSVVGAGTVAVLAWAGLGLQRGTPRAHGRAMLAGVVTVVVALTFGMIIDRPLALATVVAVVALLALVSLPSARAWITSVR